MATFELLRLSLTERKNIQQELFSEKIDPISREDFLRKVFSKNTTFYHQSNEFHYVPSNDIESGNMLIGRIGRSFISDENLPPEQGLQESEHVGWKASAIVIDPTHHSDGQKISFQFQQKVGKPFPLIKSLIKEINDQKESIYHIDVEPIFSPKTFWGFVDKHKGEVTSIKFDFTAPNMFGSSDDLSEELKQFRDMEKAQKIEIKLKSEDGLETDTDRLRQAVDYAQKGTGTILARTRTGKTYNSLSTTDKVSISEEDSDEPLLVRIARKISMVLGHE